MSIGARKTALLAAGGALALAGIGAYAWHVSLRPPVLELYVWNTPGYPAVFIRTPSDRRILVNGGSNADIIRRLTTVLPFYSRRVDLVIATNEDAKAVTGLVEAANRYDIGAALVRSATSSDQAHAALMQTIERRGVAYEAAAERKSLDLDDAVSSDILNTDRDMVMRIRYAQSSFLLVGHAPLKAQNETALALASSSQVDALILAANPIRSNLSKKLVAAARPKRIVYSATAQSRAAASAASKEKTALLAGIMDGDRYNIREAGGVRISSDGTAVTVIPLK